jgi:mono/diheme cytochrome c family protein
MNKTLMPQSILLSLCLGLAGSVAAIGQAQKTIKEVPARMTRTLDGKELFGSYCAVCHGADARGNGPAADALKKQPSDLTQISHKNGGNFPTLKVELDIIGDSATIAHGTREMPMWGTLFSENSQQRAMGHMRVSALVNYIEQIQAR